MPRTALAIVFAALAALAAAAAPHQPVLAGRGCGETEALTAPDGDAPVEQWTYQDDEAGFYDVTDISGDTVYVSSAYPGCAFGFLRFAALDAETGEPIWSLGEADLPGIVTSQPVQYGDRILFGLNDENGAYFIDAIDATSGEEAWRFDTGENLARPAGLVDDLLLLAAGDLDLTTVSALDLTSGDAVWTTDLPGYVSQLTLGPDAVYTTVRTGRADAFEYAATALAADTGAELWTLPASNFSLDVRAADNERAYATLGDPFGPAQRLTALDPASGETLWSIELAPDDAWQFQRLLPDGILLRGNTEESISLMVIDPASGEQTWANTWTADETGIPNPSVVLDADPAADADTALLEWANDAAATIAFAAINLGNGDTRWSSAPVSAGTGHALTLSGGTAYLATSYGDGSTLAAFDGGDGSERWSLTYRDYGDLRLVSTDDTSLYVEGSDETSTTLIALNEPQ